MPDASTGWPGHKRFDCLGGLALESGIPLPSTGPHRATVVPVLPQGLLLLRHLSLQGQRVGGPLPQPLRHAEHLLVGCGRLSPDTRKGVGGSGRSMGQHTAYPTKNPPEKGNILEICRKQAVLIHTVETIHFLHLHTITYLP